MLPFVPAIVIHVYCVVVFTVVGGGTIAATPCGEVLECPIYSPLPPPQNLRYRELELEEEETEMNEGVPTDCGAYRSPLEVPK